MVGIFISLIRFISQALVILVIAQVFVSYFLNPYHTVRLTLDRVVNPLLNPIRRLLPSTGMIDFSPIVLIILINLIEYLLISLLVRML